MNETDLLQDVSIDNPNSELQDILISLETLNVSCVKEPNLAYTVGQALELLLNYSWCQSASIFIMNNESFEFEHSATIPEPLNNDIKETFSMLIENGSIGAAVSTWSIQKAICSDDPMAHFIIMPLVSISGIIALIISKIGIPPDYENLIVIQFLRLYAIVFSNILSNILNLEKNKKYEEIMKQQVASRTLKLVETKKQLADKFKDLQSNLSMSLPHEVRTPLNMILGNTKFLKEHFSLVEFDDAIEILGDIQTAAERMNRLFENYLYFTKLSITATDTNELNIIRQQSVPDVISLIENIVSYKANEYKRMEDVNLELVDSELSISEELMSKLLKEVLDNSFKYSESGTEIIIHSAITSDKYKLSITDQGRGMTKEQIESIEAYHQFERKAYEQQGTGLGLAIVQRIVDIVDGKLTIESQPGEFTVLRLELPLKIEN